ncbi:unnamed protein product [Adineta ricciae]|uniref:F-box domain-containing protein n=1 Tax=Adineta ricciae TaxID=249248 RepID=A0A814QAC7_ADIRI|nr:unnamed protein product [Adineta ricciae]CAF1366988.1 unnamed protein product [Adineta ricciae]
MSLEILANELLFDLFEYFSSVDLFHSFNSLNSRFDQLLIDYFQQKKSFDFRLIYKEDLNLIRRRYLSSFIDKITSISLSNDDTTPHAIDTFLSRLYPLHRFVNLQSITLYKICSTEKVLRLLNDLQHISQLNRLILKQCYIAYNPKTLVDVMDKIWQLPNLTHCCLDITSDDDCPLVLPTFISCSLKHLSIGGFRCDLDYLFHLYGHTPYIEYLSVNLYELCDEYPQLPLLHTLTKLELKCEASFHMIQVLLRKTVNLKHLTIELTTIGIDGQKWQELIRTHLTQLEVFNLKMDYRLTDFDDDLQEEVDELIDTYRTPFWIEEHQWFVRCFGFVKDDNVLIHLHTLPYRFEEFHLEMNDGYIFKSTCPKEDDYLIYNHVRKLKYDCNLSDDENIPSIQFTNLQYLALTFPYDDQFHAFVPQLDQLTFLEVRMNTRSHDDNNLLQLQSILDQAPCLYYLKFHSWLATTTKSDNKNKKVLNAKMAPYGNQSSSVRYLDLQGWNHFSDYQFYNEQQCSALIQSPLGKQCEHLLIEVDKRANILDLVKKMKQLKTLNVRCRDRKSNSDELMKWLQFRLPSTCTFAKDIRSSKDICLWIR